MKFIIFISTRLRQGHYPKLPGFSYSEKYGKWIFGGREFSPEEFNDAAAEVFSPVYRANGYVFQPKAIFEEAVADEEPAKVPESPEKAENEVHSFENFSLVADEVFIDGEKVASFKDGKFRMVKGQSQHKEKVEEYLLFLGLIETESE